MKKIILTILILVCTAGCIPASAKQPKNDIITTQKSQLEKRQFQTRTYAGEDKTLIMKAMLNVLQDEGFIVNNANPLLGFISGTKEFDANDKNADATAGKKGGLKWKGAVVSVIEGTANVTEYGKEIKVRINFKRKVLNLYGNAQVINDIDDENYYQDFFAKVDKAIFLQKQKI